MFLFSIFISILVCLFRCFFFLFPIFWGFNFLYFQLSFHICFLFQDFRFCFEIFLCFHFNFYFDTFLNFVFPCFRFTCFYFSFLFIFRRFGFYFGFRSTCARKADQQTNAGSGRCEFSRFRATQALALAFRPSKCREQLRDNEQSDCVRHFANSKYYSNTSIDSAQSSVVYVFIRMPHRYTDSNSSMETTPRWSLSNWNAHECLNLSAWIKRSAWQRRQMLPAILISQCCKQVVAPRNNISNSSMKDCADAGVRSLRFHFIVSSFLVMSIIMIICMLILCLLLWSRCAYYAYLVMVRLCLLCLFVCGHIMLTILMIMLIMHRIMPSIGILLLCILLGIFQDSYYVY